MAGWHGKDPPLRRMRHASKIKLDARYRPLKTESETIAE